MFAQSMVYPYLSSSPRLHTPARSLCLSWRGSQLFFTLLSPHGRTLLLLSVGTLIVLAKPVRRPWRRSGRALPFISRAAWALRRGYEALGLNLILVGPARRMLCVLEALGYSGSGLTLTWLPAKACSLWVARRPRSLKRSYRRQA